ncbi:hypothetical protein N1027_17705 [Herbiconiux sp. CPCC 205763]|uniref:Asparagine synthase n=1 Tax=Herbiconiux aconitum TaxID=2970913 RepID=A0ABT2GXD4_9MICO|nr:hypothetical protein [Herbiconiux aconitum]MCS5719970.1 hypothetical protein [Herbiconiux aconitum]
MGWRRRERAPRWLATGKPVEAPESFGPESVEAAIVDGMLIARFSVVMAVKNRLIVAALRDDQRFDRDRAAEIVRAVVEEVALEQEMNEEHADEVIEHAEGDRGVARHEHDYKSRDVELLAARRRVYHDVARDIRLAAADPKWVATVVEDARGAAWDDIGRELSNRLDDVERVSNVVVDEEYFRDRDERMRRLREFDLWELADQHYGGKPKRGRSS